ncbi:MAG: hypothetical protein JWO36_365 [Myxococcales bacterium]|nr:hypothetical protein [Myxococcales bacterium]
MRVAVVISVAVALFWGCGDPEVSRLKDVKQVVCACKTSACAEAALKQVPQSEIKSTPRAQKIAREMLDCLAKLYEADRPSSDPDATPPESAPASAQTP